MPRSPAIFLIYSLRCRGSWEYSRHLTSWWSSGDMFWGRSCLLMPLSLWWTLWISSQTFLYWILSLGTLHLLSGSDFRLYSLTFKVSTLCAVIFILSILCDQIVPCCPWISIKSYWLQLGMPLKGLIEYSLGFGNTKKLLFFAKLLVLQRDMQNCCSVALTELFSEVYPLRKFPSISLTKMGGYFSCSVVVWSENELGLCLKVFCLCSEDPLPVRRWGTGCPWVEPVLALPFCSDGFIAVLNVSPVSH